ncbi:hypothetical protein MJO54_23605 [Mycolicibacter virginiensis]|nr:hypothetical protein MJO54_23605 [Mycolicibacter virginiensis]
MQVVPIDAVADQRASGQVDERLVDEIVDQLAKVAVDPGFDAVVDRHVEVLLQPTGQVRRIVCGRSGSCTRDAEFTEDGVPVRGGEEGVPGGGGEHRIPVEIVGGGVQEGCDGCFDRVVEVGLGCRRDSQWRQSEGQESACGSGKSDGLSDANAVRHGNANLLDCRGNGDGDGVRAAV